MNRPALDLNNIDHVMDWLFEQCDWPPTTKLLYLALYRYRRNPKADIRMKGIARELGTADMTAYSALRLLERVGAVRVIKKTIKGRRVKLPNEYILTPPWEAVQAVERTPRGMHAPQGGLPAHEEG